MEAELTQLGPCCWKCVWWRLSRKPGHGFVDYSNMVTLWMPDTYYSLTPWCRVLPEQLTGLQLVKKFTAFHGTPRFITALRSFRHLSLSWVSPIQSIYPHPISWRSVLILSTHLRLVLPIDLSSLRFPHQDPIHPHLLTHTYYKK